MFDLVRRIRGTDLRSLEAERVHAERIAELERINDELEDMKAKLLEIGGESRREGLGLAHSLEEFVRTLPPGAVDE